jgi:fructose transport system substrate-binding protein
LALAIRSAAFAASEPIIGLITKTETNPFFVKMKEGAKAEAKKMGAPLMTAAGKADGDTMVQITAIQNMVAAGAKTILITASGDAIIPTVKKVQAKGVQVIALDSPFEGADALFATDNYKAGVLNGQYAKAALGNKPAKIAILDLFPGHPVGAQRHNGFMTGFGLKAFDAKSNELSSTAGTVCAGDTGGNQAKGQTAMENCLQKDPSINVVHTINELAAAGVFNALKMAAMGVVAGVEYAKTGKKASGYVDTGVTLIAAKSIAGVDSKDTKVGMALCWGTK